ncbi:MAG: trehalose 2-sulfotransferase [Sphingomonadales bacterium]|jgi:LPS sulfotransferase NodH|nr:trehalose 2-sulfotransferase [Sphingomonadales bacterium]
MADAQARMGYVICSEARSGSNLLCELLRSTGKLGRPREFFSDKSTYRDIEQRPGAFEAMIEEATTPNGVYGVKLFTRQFDLTMKSGWIHRLPDPHFISLERRDLLGQAISYVRAVQTGQFRAGPEKQGEPRYDARAIARTIARLADDEARWRRYFARNGIRPLWLTYEQLAAGPEAAVAAVAAGIGLDEEVRIDWPAVQLVVQRDAMSDEWRSRFLAERADIAWLDHRLGKGRVALRRLARRLGLVRRGAR